MTDTASVNSVHNENDLPASGRAHLHFQQVLTPLIFNLTSVTVGIEIGMGGFIGTLQAGPQGVRAAHGAVLIGPTSLPLTQEP